MIEAGRVYLPKDASWLAEFENEVLAFPYGKYDDQVDSMVHFLNWARGDVRPKIKLTISTFGGTSVRDRYFERTGIRVF